MNQLSINIKPSLLAASRRRAWALLACVALIGWEGGARADTPAPPYLSAAEAAKHVLTTLPPERFGNPEVRRAYLIAKRIPQLMAQQPCYCWCSRGGHKSLLDCYVDEHASACQICMKEAFLTEQMARQGKSASAIRAAITCGEWRNL